MAYITKVSGGSQPVFASDVLNGSIAQSANIAQQGPFNPAGPKLDFFSAVANASVAAQGGVNGYVANVIQAVQQTATVAIFQVSADAVTMNFAVYPTGAFANVATFLTAVQGANATIGASSASNTVAFTTLVS
jgi:hypothetical protein